MMTGDSRVAVRRNDRERRGRGRNHGRQKVVIDTRHDITRRRSSSGSTALSAVDNTSTAVVLTTGLADMRPTGLALALARNGLVRSLVPSTGLDRHPGASNSSTL